MCDDLAGRNDARDDGGKTVYIQGAKDQYSYKIKQENGRRRENTVHSFPPLLLFR